MEKRRLVRLAFAIIMILYIFLLLLYKAGFF